MASALRRAAETAAKSHETVDLNKTGTGQPAASETKMRESWPSTGVSSGYAAASAPAPAKEMPKPAKKDPELRLMLPHEASEMVEAALPSETSYLPYRSESYLSDVREPEGSDPGGGMKILLIATAATVLIVGAYVGWTKIHKAMPSQATQEQSATVQTASSATTRASDIAPAKQDAGSVESQIQEPQQPPAASEGKPSAGKTTITRTDDVEPSNEVGLTVQEVPSSTPEPIVVKKGPSASVRKSPQDALQPPPAALAVPAVAGDKALGGIITTTTVSIPISVPQVVKVSQGVSEGLLVKRVQPIYPEQARQMRVQGPVQLQATINKNGNISNVKVVSGNAQLARATVEAVKQWKYKPYYLNNEPVEIQTQIIVNFKLP
jgi:TonB family protein